MDRKRWKDSEIGAAASGDFNLETSDIDFVIVTEDILSDETISKLESMHKQIWSSGLKWSAKLEGSYIPKNVIRRHNPAGPPCPTVNEGRFFVDKRGSDWIIQRHVIRECGVVLEGPDPKSLIDSVHPDEIRRAVIGILNEWWFPILENPAWLCERGGKYHAYAVITMCRSIHALQHGTILSKPAAAKWAQDELGDPWSSLINKALLAQHGKHKGFLKETLDFIRFTKGRMAPEGVTELPHGLE